MDDVEGTMDVPDAEECAREVKEVRERFRKGAKCSEKRGKLQASLRGKRMRGLDGGTP